MNRLIIALLLLSSSASSAFLYYEQPTPELYLEDIGTPPSCDYIIDTPAKWNNINSTQYRVFCVAPGDYSSVGTITINSDGTAAAKRWLRYYDPTGQVSDSTHPYHMPDEKRARINNLTLTGADYWIIDRIFIKPAAGTLFGTSSAYIINSDHNVLNKIYTDRMSQGLQIQIKSDYNVIQHCVVSNMLHGSDGTGLFLNAISYPPASNYARFNRIVSNECFDVNDCFHIGGYAFADARYVDEEDYEGTVVYDNDLYLTSVSYTNCNGTYTPSGECACKENAADIKSASENATNPVIFAHNRMWGWRVGDAINCGAPSGGNTTNFAVVGHNLVNNLRVEGNIAWDTPGGINVSRNDAVNIGVKGNLVHSLFVATGIANAAGVGLYIGTPEIASIQLEGNVLVDTGNTALFRSFNIFSAATTDADMTFKDNVFINAHNPLGAAFAGTVSGNKYYNSAKLNWDTTPAADEPSVTGSGWDNEFCTTIKRITAPETKCFANALYSDGSPSVLTPPSNFRPND